MSRYLKLFAFVAIFGSVSLAQTPPDSSTGSGLDNSNRHSEIYAGSPSVRAANVRISVARLKETRKAQKLYNKALEAWADKKLKLAERRVDQALRAYPRFPEALTLQAGIQASCGEWLPAEANLRAATAIDPDYSPAYVVLAGLYNAQSRFDDAKQATDQALSAGADNWDVRYEIARALIGKGQYKSALVVAESALQTKHGSLLHLAKAHALMGLLQYRQAARELRVYLRYQPSGDGSEQAHELLYKLQNVIGE
ncbi:MAG TPA: tetratricopeptide repeat protein [Candidatus Sulfotelmatobacter sp.]|nr:tetratricopeptide repeat protein [Candidatus Sulfotelmatobacter sp.]